VHYIWYVNSALHMVFWTNYSFSILFNSFSTNHFKASTFVRERLPLSNGISCTIFTPTNLVQYKRLQICSYLRTYFGNPPSTPVLDIPEQSILGPYDLIIVLEYNGLIVGTIRYHYIGEYLPNKENIYCVDCFCIHPTWRKKGLGDFLLTELHHYANEHNIPYCMFLKEGQLLQTIHFPFYTGTYVYRQLSHRKHHPSFVYKLSVEKAYRLMDQWTQIQPHLFIIRNRQSTNQEWLLYKRGIYYVLACIQNTFQKKDNQQMGWITAWLESPYMVDSIRSEASEQISATSSFDYLWMNKEWVGDSKLWKTDGLFHWYSYQWTTGLTIGKSYCILT